MARSQGFPIRYKVEGLFGSRFVMSETRLVQFQSLNLGVIVSGGTSMTLIPHGGYAEDRRF